MTEHWLIVGACSDLGQGIAWQLAKHNKALLLADHQTDCLNTLADQLVAAGYPEPQLIAIDHHQLEHGCEALTQALKQRPNLSGYVWAGYDLKQPTPMTHISLEDWQHSLMRNVTYPWWLLRACLPAMSATSTAWFATPTSEAYTHGLSASISLWEHWLLPLSRELGASAPRLLAWHIPMIADRIHRRIWPLAPLEQFTPIDTAIEAWIHEGWHTPLTTGHTWASTPTTPQEIMA